MAYRERYMINFIYKLTIIYELTVVKRVKYFIDYHGQLHLGQSVGQSSNWSSFTEV